MTSIAFAFPASQARAASLPVWAAVAMALMSGCLLALAYSLHPLWWAACAAPVPVIAAALNGQPSWPRRLGALAGLIAGSTTFGYYTSVTGWPVAVGILLARVWFWSGMVTLAVRSARRLPAWGAVFAWPAFAAGIETVVLAVSPHGSYGSLAYSQMDALPVIQVAALGGVPAIVFMVSCAGALGGLVVGRLMGAVLDARDLAIAAALVTAIWGGVLVFGSLRLASPPHGRPTPIRLVVTDQFAGEPRSWGSVWAAYAPAVKASSSPGGAIVLPEGIALLSMADATDAALQITALAKEHAETILVGIEVRDEAGRYADRALVAGPDGRVSWYDKRHLVPGLEARDRPGARLLLTSIGGVRTGVAICKDMHFPALGRENAHQGAALMLVPAWDFDRDGWMSDRLTALRGVESGFAVARSTRDGVSSVSDRFGRILVEARSGSAPAVLRYTLRLPATADSTVYSRVGDLFGWTAALCTVVMLIQMLTPATKTRVTEPQRTAQNA